MADLSYIWRTTSDADDLSALHREIASSVAAILRFVPNVSPDHRPRLLTLASELLAAQSRAIDSVASPDRHSQIISQSSSDDYLSALRQCRHPISYVPHAHLDPIESTRPSAPLCFDQGYPPVAQVGGAEEQTRYSRDTTWQGVASQPLTGDLSDAASGLDRITAEIEWQFGTEVNCQHVDSHTPSVGFEPLEGDGEDNDLDDDTAHKAKLVTVVWNIAARFGASPQASLLPLALAGLVFWLFAGSPNGQAVGPQDASQRTAALNEPLPHVDRARDGDVAADTSSSSSQARLPANALSTSGKTQSPLAASLATTSLPNESQPDHDESIEEPQTPPAALIIEPPPAPSPSARGQSPTHAEQSPSISRNASSELTPLRKKTLTLAHGDQARAANGFETDLSSRQLQKNVKSAATKSKGSDAFRPAKNPASSSQVATNKVIVNAALQTASITPPAGRFAPVLVALRDKQAVLQVFADLKTRYAATLANKTAQVRSFTGADGQTWYRVAAHPAVTEQDAKAICRALGPEGEALECAVAPE